MAQAPSPIHHANRLPIIAIGLALIAAACGGGSAPSTTTTAPAAPPATTASTTTTPPPTSTTTTAPAAPDIPATATIVVVQGDLAFLGYYDGPTDGIAGDETQAALSAFQTDAGIDVDGEYGPQTDTALASALEANEDYVTNLQEQLIEKKLYPGPIDGDYGKGTKNAVIAFQKECDIEETGLLDIATRLCLADL